MSARFESYRIVNVARTGEREG